MRSTSSLLSRLVCLIAMLGLSPLIAAEPDWLETDPLWELGVFLGAAQIPAYRGSSESRNYTIPLPYGVYRGDIVSFDRESITGLFFQSDAVDVDTSMLIDFNDNDEARHDMEELDPLILAVGPAIKIYMRRIERDGYNLYFDIPIRAAVSANNDDGIDTAYRGAHVKANLFYENKKMFGSPRFEFTSVFGFSFYDSEFAAYYYDVDDAFVLPDRPAFDSGAGYAGAAASVDMLYRLTSRIAVRLYGRIDSLHGAVFEDSPLVSESVTGAAGVAVMVNLWQSKKRVPRR